MASVNKLIAELQSDMALLVEDKAEVQKVLCDGGVVTKAVTMTGKIDEWELEIKGMVPRQGPRSANPPGPCMWCERMIQLGSTKQLAEHGLRCRWAGQGRRGHIQTYPPALRAIIESEDFSQQLRESR